MAESKQNATIIGAGLVGSLLALYLANKGSKVSIYERRPDMRKTDIGGGRSINLALSDRGWKALEGIGIGKEIREVAIPMYRRVMHDVKGNLTFQPYGKENQAIYSVSRGGLNMTLMDLAEAHPNVDLNFNYQLTNLDLRTNELAFLHPDSKAEVTLKAERIFGTDGAFSMVRGALQKTERFDYSQHYLEYGYKELTIAPGENGTWQLEKNALHIWPRGQYMMIALPNLDGSFTCTLFFPYEGEHSFSAIKNETDLVNFFGEVFPDVLPLMPGLKTDYFTNPTGSLVTVKCFPWSLEDKVLLLGDASHAIVPFYGQGMNAGFEDCTVLNQLMEKSGTEDWESIFKEFEKLRKPNTDAMADLAVYNFIEMRDKVADPAFLLQKKIEAKINAQYPDQWLPLYSMVTFSDTPYADALHNGKTQDKIMRKLMKLITTEADYDKPEVQKLLQKELNKKFGKV